MKNRKPLPPFMVVNELLAYDPDTGVFTWKISPARRMPAGSVAGSVDALGYRRIRIKGYKLLKAHRLAWLLYTGSEPPLHLDVHHHNGERDDNRFINLHLISSRAHRNHHYDRGDMYNISWNKLEQRFKVCFYYNGKLEAFGTFQNVQDAIDRRNAVESDLRAADLIQ